MAGHGLQAAADFTGQFPVAGDPLRRRPVRFGKHDVQGHDACACVPQLFNQPGHPRAGPGPLTESLKAFLVDVDDANGGGLIGTGMPALVLIENSVAQHLQRQRFREENGQTQKNG